MSSDKSTTVPAFSTVLESSASWNIDVAIGIFYKFIMPSTKSEKQSKIKQKLPRWLYNSRRWAEMPEFRQAFNLSEFNSINKLALDELEKQTLKTLFTSPQLFGADASYKENFISKDMELTEKQKDALDEQLDKYTKDLTKLKKGLRDLRASLNDASNKAEIEERIIAQEEEIDIAEDNKEALEIQSREGSKEPFNDEILLKEIAGPSVSDQAPEFYSYISLAPQNEDLARALGYSIDEVQFRELTEEEVAERYPGVTKHQILQEREKIIQEQLDDPDKVKRVASKKTAFASEEKPEGHEYEQVEYLPADEIQSNKRQKDMETWFKDYSLLTSKLVTRPRKAGETYEIKMGVNDIIDMLFKHRELNIQGTFKISKQKSNVFIVKLKPPPSGFLFDPKNYLATKLFGGSTVPIVVTEGSKRGNTMVIKGEIEMPKKVRNRLTQGSAGEHYTALLNLIKNFINSQGLTDTKEEFIEEFDQDLYNEIMKGLDLLNEFKSNEKFEEYFEYDKGYDSNYFNKDYDEIRNILLSDEVDVLARQTELSIDFLDEIIDKYKSNLEETDEVKETDEVEKADDDKDEGQMLQEALEEESFDDREEEEIALIGNLINKIEEYGYHNLQLSYDAIKNLKQLSSQIYRIKENNIRDVGFIKLLRKYINSSNMTDFGEYSEEEFIGEFKNLPAELNRENLSRIRQLRNIIMGHHKNLDIKFKKISNKEAKELLNPQLINLKQLFASALVDTELNNGFFRYRIKVRDATEKGLNLKFNINTNKITLSGKIHYTEEEKYTFTGRRKEGKKGTAYLSGIKDVHAKASKTYRQRIGPTGEKQKKAGQATNPDRRKFFRNVQRRYKELLEVVD